MTLEGLRKRNAERRQQMKSRSRGTFDKYVNHKDTKIIKLIAPFDGFDREVKNMQGKMQLRPHYRYHVLGDYNFVTNNPISAPPVKLSIEAIRALRIEEAKIWTTPVTAALEFQDLTDKGYSIFWVQRNGQPKDTKTYYTVLRASQVDDDDWKRILPNVTKEEIAKLQSEEKFDEISDEEREALENIGGGGED